MPPQPAYVLHQWDWSETSLILELFSREGGRIAAVAKGAKRPYSQLRPVLMPFQRLLVTVSRPAERTAPLAGAQADDAGGQGGDIVTLRSAEYAGGGSVLPPERLMAGFYLNELLLKLLARGDPHPALFDAYGDALAAMAGDGGEAPLRAFELLLLRGIGLLPELDRDTLTQRPVRDDLAYRLDAQLGLVACGSDDAAAPVAALPGALARALEQGLQQAQELASEPAHPPQVRFGVGEAVPDAPAPGADEGPAWALAPLRPAPHPEPEAAVPRRPAAVGARLRAACALAPAALRQQLRPLLHYHLGTPVLRTRELTIAARRLSEPPSTAHEPPGRP